MGSLIIFAKALFTPSKFNKTQITWGHLPNSCVGASSACYLFPALSLLVCCAPGRFPQFYSAAFVLQTLFSFLSDYLYSGIHCIVHGLDRTLASLLTLRMLLFAAGSVSLYWATLAVVPLCCFVKSKRASSLGDYEAYVFWHSLWHFSSGSLVAVTVWLASAGNNC
jgi:hypothetical protein